MVRSVVKIGLLVGSLRKESFTKKIATNVASLFPEDYTVEVLEIGQLPFYNQDFDDENKVPEAYITFRNQVRELDAFLIVTPEYNRSVPAVLSNALDIGSRPKISNAWSGKPAAIVSQSPGNLGGFGANHHLRQILTAINMPTLQQPEAYISNSAKLLNEKGNIYNESTVQFLQEFVDAFVDLIQRHA